MKKIILYIIGATALIVIVLIFLNPSLRAFKEYNSDLETKGQKVVYRRVSNYLIFSIFEKVVYEVDRYDDAEVKSSERYTGFLRNFWRRD